MLPCLWRVGGGLIALLPLQAAGKHSLESTENSMSHVVSSYAPTLKALQIARKQARVLPTANQNRILVVAMHKRPGQDDLNMADEIASVQQHVGSTTSMEVIEGPKVVGVADAPEDSSYDSFRFSWL